MAKPEAVPLRERVREILRADGVLYQALTRGFVNHRALSRWMISEFDLKGSEEAVLSAIRRLKLGPPSDPYRAARAIIGRCHLNVRSRACQVFIPRSDDVSQKLPQVLQLIDPSKGEILYFTRGEFGIKVLLDESNLAAVQALFGSRIKKVTRRLSAVTVVQPEEGLDTPGILAMLSETQALHGINVVDAVYGYPDFTFFVKDADTLRAYQAFEVLIATAGTRPRRA